MTDPLTPADCDLRDFAYMPLDVVRLRDSEAAVILTPEEFRAAVILWCAAWHQVPAASMPKDDRLLANLAGYGRDVNGWSAVKTGALRGFIECSDGRLYHPVIAEKAMEAWDKKWARPDRAAERSEHARKAATARWEKKKGNAQAMPEHMPEQCPDHALKGMEGNGEEKKDDDDDARAGPANLNLTGSPALDRELTLAMLPRLTDSLLAAMPERKGGHPKKATASAFRAALLDGHDADAIIAYARGYADEAQRNGIAGSGAIKPADMWLLARPWANPVPEWKRTGGYELARAVAEIAGRADELETTGWGGAAQRAQMWIEKGWDEQHILASVRDQASRKTSPPNRINYFERGIAEHIARQNAPLPAVIDLPAKTIEVKRERQSTGSVTAAARRLAERFEELARPPGVRSEEGGASVRLLPQGGGE